MIPENVWLATAVATVPAVLLDMASGMIQRWQIRRGGGEPGDSIGPFGRFLLSLVQNAFVLGGLSFLYFRLWAGSGRAFLYVAVVWLLISIPASLYVFWNTVPARRVLSIHTVRLYALFCLMILVVVTIDRIKPLSFIKRTMLQNDRRAVSFKGVNY